MLQNDQLIFIQHEHDVDMDLCNLLQTMKLDVSNKFNNEKESTRDTFRAPQVEDDIMQEDRSYQSDGESACSSTSSGTCHEEFPGCAYLRAIRMQMDNYQTTSGIYLETIFTHREILCAYPDAHRHCAHALSDLAYMLEKRAWRADRDSDSEAVTAFRHEAWSIAASFSSLPK